MKSIVPLLLIAVAAQAAPTAPTPATLTKEGDLMTIVLKPDAEERLRLKTVPVERRAVPGARLFSGEVVRALAQGEAPLAPVVGGTLDEVLRLADLQAAADGRILQAETQVEAAKIALGRAEKVLSVDAGSVRSVDEAKATLKMAEVALRTAKAQRELLGGPIGQKLQGKPAWVRVAVYSGESALLDPQAAATVRTLAAASGQPAKPVAGPLTANALTTTVDWYYELSGTNAFRAGERVAVEIPLREGETEKLVVPTNAILHDIHGGQWVYENISAHTYARKRVQVARLAGELAVLASGPAAGARIVTDGAAELFGTEFMTGK